MLDTPTPAARAAELTVLWAAKGGAGTTTVAAALAVATPDDTVLIDLDGDLPAVLGIPEPGGDGIADWLATTASVDTLDSLIVPIDRTTRLLPRGHIHSDRHSRRWRDVVVWAASHPHVIVDAGTQPPPADLHEAGRSVLVTRACYLALRHAVAADDRPDAVILVNEPGRALRAADVERAVGQRVIATVDIDPAVARAIDAGLLAARLPHLLQSQLRAALPSAPAPHISFVPAVSIDSRRLPALHSVISLERTEHGHRPVTVDAHVGAGVPGYEIHGIPDAALRESRDRIRAAVLNSGLAWPDQRITINIAPHSPALDSNLDLAIAAGILASTGQLDPGALDRFAYIGELGLEGSVRNGPGAPEHATIVELTRRPPAAVEHLGELARRYPAAASYGHDLATTQTPAAPAMPAAPGIAADGPAQQIVAQWQHPVAPMPGEAAHPLGGLA
jgi:hypothetical protein